MTTFNIRKLSIYRDNAKREMATCNPKYRNQARYKLGKLEFALFMARQQRALKRMAT